MWDEGEEDGGETSRIVDVLLSMDEGESGGGRGSISSSVEVLRRVEEEVEEVYVGRI